MRGRNEKDQRKHRRVEMEDKGLSREEVYEKMAKNLKVMKDGATEGREKEVYSLNDMFSSSHIFNNSSPDLANILFTFLNWINHYYFIYTLNSLSNYYYFK